ncbi:MAG: NAD(P)H-hydrate epimerase [Thermomicrobiales bacterium]
MTTHPCPQPQIPAVTASQMLEADRIMTEVLGVDLLQMMELAGGALATLARDRFLGGDPRGKQVLVLAGSGGNGGGGMVAARRLHGWCADVEVWLTRAPDLLRGAAARQAQSLNTLGVPLHAPCERPSLPTADVAIDALIGYSLDGPPSSSAAALIRAVNEHLAPVLSLDLPSGLEATTGVIFAPCVRADATLALALPKMGLWAPWAHEVTGEFYLADIGVPEAIYMCLGLDVGPIFARQSLLRIG